MKRVMSLIVTLAFTLFLSANLIFAAENMEPAEPTEPVLEKNEAPPAKAELVDINTATEDQLITLPGIGEDLARKIIANRPYIKKEELMLKGIIPGTVYELIKDRIRAAIKAKI